MLVFRQLFDPTSSTYTYLLADSDSREAVMIDPVFEEAPRDSALVRELGLTLLYTLETHVHADHVTGAWDLKQRLGSKIAVSGDGGADGADLYLKDRDRVKFGTRYLQVRATPGHTDGCLTYVLDDETMAFTGDCVLVRGCGRTDFQQGDPRAMYRAVHAQIFSLPESCLLYPAHDYRGLTVSSVGEERRFNPRFGGELCEDDFVGYMKNLGLPHPEADGHRRAGQFEMRPPRRARGPGRASELGAAGPDLRRHLGGAAPLGAGASARGAGDRRARARRVRRAARPHPGCRLDPARRSGRACRGDR